MPYDQLSYMKTTFRSILSFFSKSVYEKYLQHLNKSWLVGCFRFSGRLRQYFNLYRAVSQREGERGEMIEEGKMSKQPPPAPTASTIGPCPIIIQIVGRPGTGSLPRTIALPDHAL